MSRPQPHLWAGSHQLWGVHTSKQGTHSVLPSPGINTATCLMLSSSQGGGLWVVPAPGEKGLHTLLRLGLPQSSQASEGFR